jgi:putative holliday junction resolvase
MNRSTMQQSFMAFDFGLRRTGVAVGNRISQSAQALSTVQASGDARWPLIARLITEWQPDALVVGVPYHPDGAAHENTQRAQRFAAQLRGRFAKPVHEVDERYSTVEAASTLCSERGASAVGAPRDKRGKHGGRAKAHEGESSSKDSQSIDARSAQVILAQFLLELD